MSFYSSLSYYRPRKPPQVTASDLGILIKRLDETGKLRPVGLRGLKVKFGESIDVDNKETVWYKQLLPNLAEVHEIEWDLELRNVNDLDEMCAALEGNSATVYRAHVFLGGATEDVVAAISRANSPENKIDFVPYGLSLELGPIIGGLLSTEDAIQVGWISMKFSGDGYLYPWSFPEIVTRAEQSQPIRILTTVMRNMWPVPSEPPEMKIVDLRRQLPEIWPYQDAERNWDWYWGVHETG